MMIPWKALTGTARFADSLWLSLDPVLARNGPDVGLPSVRTTSNFAQAGFLRASCAARMAIEAPQRV